MSNPDSDVPSVLTGADVLARDDFGFIDGSNVGLVTNHTGLLRDGRTATADALFQADNVRLKVLFSPEHGIRGTEDVAISDSTDERTRLPVYSLYGTRQEPTAEMLADVDTLVFDIQDIGTRFYTYLSTLGHCLHAAARVKSTGAKRSLRIVVCDRPNPISGNLVEGPLVDETRLSFTAFHPIPVRHGMTIGELALLINAEREFNADLHVIRCENWHRADWWDATGLLWTDTSPNIRSLTSATVYPGIGLLEFTNLSVGRGTDAPFEKIGAPWIDGRTLAYTLNSRNLPGVRFIPIDFRPTSSVYANEQCSGVQLLVVDRLRFTPVRTGFEIALALRDLYTEEWQASRFMTLLANRTVMDGLLAGEEYTQLSKRWQADSRGFMQSRKNFLLYD